MRALAALLVALVVAAPPSGTSAAIKRVRVADLSFEPAAVRVNVGDIVRWRWVGTARHNVTVSRGPRKFHSRTKREGRFAKRLGVSGTYRYLCTVHPDAMRGRVVVE